MLNYWDKLSMAQIKYKQKELPHKHFYLNRKLHIVTVWIGLGELWADKGA